MNKLVHFFKEGPSMVPLLALGAGWFEAWILFVSIQLRFEVAVETGHLPTLMALMGLILAIGAGVLIFGTTQRGKGAFALFLGATFGLMHIYAAQPEVTWIRLGTVGAWAGLALVSGLLAGLVFAPEKKPD